METRRYFSLHAGFGDAAVLDELSDASYNTFKTANASRTLVLLAGANDGMLHAFRESNGAESVGFCSAGSTRRFERSNRHVRDCTTFYVDGSPIAADVKIGSTPAWKTIAMFGQRRGGRNYYALDITNTTNPLYKWSFTDCENG